MADVEPAERHTAEAAGHLGGGSLGLAILLAGLAGAVDAVGFLQWRGLFVSFMSGNSTILATDAAARAWSEALQPAIAIGTFLLGVILGELLAYAAGWRGRSAVLAAEAVLLGGAAVVLSAGQGDILAAACLSLAIGMQNAAIHEASGVRVTLTFVTGTLVAVGRHLAQACLGRGSWSAALPFCGLWMGLVVGAAAGAAMMKLSVVLTLGLASAAAALFALVALSVPQRAATR